jgi:hypothetical protein
MSGMKFDNGKVDLSLIPYTALIEEAKGFMFGEKKYARDNFKEGLASHRLVAASLRHILAWHEGEDLDPESGANHLGHARCCLAMLLECERLGTLQDTRFKPKKKEAEKIITAPENSLTETGLQEEKEKVDFEELNRKAADRVLNNDNPLDYLK